VHCDDGEVMIRFIAGFLTVILLCTLLACFDFDERRHLLEEKSGFKIQKCTAWVEKYAASYQVYGGGTGIVYECVEWEPK
jgi:hypothetical protein